MYSNILAKAVVLLVLSGCAQGYYTAHATLHPSYDSDKTIVLGHITDRATGKFLSARIEVEGTMIKATSDVDGYYRLIVTSQRRYRLHVVAVDYHTISCEINALPNQTIELDLELVQGIDWVNYGEN